MKRSSHKLLLVCTALLPLLFASGAFAAGATAVRIEHAWVRWLPANLPAAGYATIYNNSGKPVKLTGATSPEYGMAMLHRSLQKNGSDSMQMVDAINIPAQGAIKLAPGGYHLMLMDAKRPIKPGDSVHITLHFAGGETLQATWPVRPANATGP